MTKLIIADNALEINDGAIILSKWICNSHYGMIIIRDFTGALRFRQKISTENPIETSEGERTDARDVVGDIGANWKGIGFGDYYQWLFTTKPNEIVDNEYINHGTGGEPINGLIKNTTIATFDGTVYLQGEVGQFDGLDIVTFIGTSFPTIDGDTITFIAGTAEYLQFSDGNEIWFQDSNGIYIYSTFGGEIGIVIVQDVFLTTPVNNLFIDSENSNDIIVSNSAARYFTWLDTSIETTQKQQGKQPYDVTWKFKAKTNSGAKVIWGNDRQSNSNSGLQVDYNVGSPIRVIVAGGGNAVVAQSTDLIVNETEYTCRVQWSGINGDDCTITVNGNDTVAPLTKDWVGDSFSPLLIGTGGSITSIPNMELYELYGTFAGVYYEYRFSTIDGTVEYDTGGNNNHGTITTSNLSNFLTAAKSDETKSAQFNYGSTLFRSNLNGDFLAIPHDKYGNILESTLADYTNLGEKTGVMLGTSNLLTWQPNSDLELALEGSGIDVNTPYEVQDILDVNASNIDKLGDTYSISQMIVKKKTNNGDLSAIENSSLINNDTIIA